jgi:hypothetical protein
LLITRGDAADYALTYETPVTSGVEGYLSPAAVTALMAQVAALPEHVPA